MEIGKIRALEPFIGMVATPLCGTVADRFSRHKLMLLACLCGTALVYGSSVFLPFLSPAGGSHMNSIHTEPNVTNSTSDIRQMVFGGFFRRHPHMVAAMDSFNISYLSYSDLQESIEESSCNFTNTKRRHGSTVTVYLEDMHGCSFTKLPLEPSSVFKEKSGGVAPEVRCLFCEGMMRVCTFQYQMTECQNRSINCNDSFGISTPVSINDTTQFINGGMSIKEKDLLGVFVIMLVILIVGEMFAYSSVPLLDASTMTLIDEYKERGQTFEYGRQRMWGGIAHGVLAPLSGIAVDAYAASHPNAFNKYLPAFVLFVSFLVLCAATASVIPIRAKPRTTESFAKNAKSFLLTPKVILFFVIMFITGILLGFINTYLFLFLAEINGGATIMGLTLTGACAAEVPFMMFSSKLIDKIGHRGVIGIALFAFVLRFVGYSLLQNPWAVIPIELLHGVTYGSMWPACTSYIHLISPPDMAATMQSLTYSIRGGLGKGIGTIIGGVIYHNYGARNLFRGSAILSLVTLVVYFIISLIFDKREKSTGYDKL
ncbi:major facilitator superfamily domain-containing protein 6-like [Strongylocentrotus purpuratus]|uniref:Major facilitator superfamily (MFS) profile domain-containing protein n=1 Tax=Strongylocentrotus purpuratus TaxID=7668 RepID=A0A7M7T197_STRPU|nr:major facilitator superfamily domain-containing protein 6-like [Strongylocentrotus purpuratus]